MSPLYGNVSRKLCDIKVSRIIKLWVAEGFLKPIKDESLEDVAMIYLQDLIDRTLILVSKRGKSGNMKTCKINDFFWDLCIREGYKENFVCVTKSNSLDTPEGMESNCRIAIHQSMSKRRYCSQVFDALRSASFACSLVCEFDWVSTWVVPYLRFLRVLDVVDRYSPEEIVTFSSMKYLAFTLDLTDSDPEMNQLMFLHNWNIQTFIGHDYPDSGEDHILVPPIWEMTELRHLEIGKVTLPDPPESDINDTLNICSLENLQTLLTVKNFRCTEEVVIRVPNLRKLKVFYDDDDPSAAEWSSYYCIHNLVHLRRLESLTLRSSGIVPVSTIAFPRSLNKLKLSGCHLPWSEIKIVSLLPRLEVLELHDNAFQGTTWSMYEGEFVILKYLSIVDCDLKYWITFHYTQFPMLENLHLECSKLEEIPNWLAKIPTLQLIRLGECQHCVITIAREILEDRDMLGYEGLQVEMYSNEEQRWIRIEIYEEY